MDFSKAKIRKTFNYLIRALIVAATYGFIYRQVFVNRKLDDIQQAVGEMLTGKPAWLMLLLMLTMMAVNWGAETVKWRLLISRIERVSFLRAYKAVLTGASVSLFTPNRTGEFLGRVFILQKANHVEGILVTIVGSFSQVVITLCAGLFAFLAYAGLYISVSPGFSTYLVTSLVIAVPSAVFLLLLLYYRLGLISALVRKLLPSGWARFSEYLDVVSRLSSRELTAVLLLSLFRYLVFSAQFFLLLRFFGVPLPAGQALILIPVIYLIMTILPTVALTDLGIRGSVSVYIIGRYLGAAAIPEAGLAIVTATSALWLINLIIPALLGTFFVFNLQFFRKKK
jgi:uncharacterized membrane protein YbhN (UPF0104 family)